MEPKADYKTNERPPGMFGMPTGWWEGGEQDNVIHWMEKIRDHADGWQSACGMFVEPVNKGMFNDLSVLVGSGMHEVVKFCPLCLLFAMPDHLYASLIITDRGRLGLDIGTIGKTSQITKKLIIGSMDRHKSVGVVRLALRPDKFGVTWAAFDRFPVSTETHDPD